MIGRHRDEQVRAIVAPAQRLRIAQQLRAEHIDIKDRQIRMIRAKPVEEGAHQADVGRRLDHQRGAALGGASCWPAFHGCRLPARAAGR
jgi:hypothetical protein